MWAYGPGEVYITKCGGVCVGSVWGEITLLKCVVWVCRVLGNYITKMCCVVYGLRFFHLLVTGKGKMSKNNKIKNKLFYNGIKLKLDFKRFLIKDTDFTLTCQEIFVSVREKLHY